MRTPFYFLLLAAVLLAACSGDGEHRRALDAAYSLINDRPDSALDILDAMPQPEATLLSKGQLRRWQLLRLMAQNKCDTVFRSDSLQRVLTDYYDQHGTPNERMWAHYLLGRAYYDMGEMPMALKEYLSAEESADTLSEGCDFRTLMSVHGQTAFVYRMQSMPKEEEKELMKYSCLAHRIGDIYNWIRGYEMTVGTHFAMGDTAQCLIVTEKCRKMYEEHDMLNEAAGVYPTAIYIYLTKAQYGKARKLMDIFENQSGLFDSQGNIERGREEYYYSQALYHLGCHRPDSALLCLNKLLSHHLRYDVMAYKGILSVYRQKDIPDSIVKYAALYENSLDKFLDEDHAENMAHMTALHRYGRVQKMAYEKNVEAERFKRFFLLVSITAVVLFLLAFFSYRKKRKSKQEELERLRSKYHDTMESLLKAEEETSLLRNGRSELLSMKEEEIATLHKRLQIMQLEISELPLSDKETLLKNNEVVKDFKKKTIPKAKMDLPSDEEWNRLWDVLKSTFPNYYAFITQNKELTTQEKKVCLLTIMFFSNTEMTVLLGTSMQRITNAKTSANSKLFFEKNAKTLLPNLRRSLQIKK